MQIAAVAYLAVFFCTVSSLYGNIIVSGNGSLLPVRKLRKCSSCEAYHIYIIIAEVLPVAFQQSIIQRICT